VAAPKSLKSCLRLLLQEGLDPNEISGVDTKMRLLVHVLPGPNKQRACKKSSLLS
jgi:hypothetical protein